MSHQEMMKKTIFLIMASISLDQNINDIQYLTSLYIIVIKIV